MKDETKEQIDALEVRVSNLVVNSAQEHRNLRDEIGIAHEGMYKNALEIQKRATFADSFWMAGAVVVLSWLLILVGFAVYYSIHDPAYRDGYIQGHNEILRKLIPQPDQQEFEHRFHCDGNGCAEQQ